MDNQAIRWAKPMFVERQIGSSAFFYGKVAYLELS